MHRQDRHRQVTVGANLGDGVVQSQVAQSVHSGQPLGLPAGYTTSQGGTAQQQAQRFCQLGVATVLGGVISSTALTSVVVPVVYTLLDGIPGK